MYLRRDLAFKGEYVGYDLSARMIAAAQKKFPEARFERRDILEDGVSEDLITFSLAECSTITSRVGGI